MRNAALLPILILLAAGTFVVRSSVFVIDESQQAIKTRFGKPGNFTEDPRPSCFPLREDRAATLIQLVDHVGQCQAIGRLDGGQVSRERCDLIAANRPTAKYLAQRQLGKLTIVFDARGQWTEMLC